jgi:hypothetical protein
MTTILLFAIGLAALLFVWLELRRPNRQRLVWRLMAVLLATAALGLLAFRPFLSVRTVPGTAILLTQGVSADSLETLLQSLPAKPAIYAIDSNLADAFSRYGAGILPDLASLRRNHPQVKSLHLLGYGLTEHHLEELDSVTVIPHLSQPSGGLDAANWTRQVALGDPLVLQGVYQNTGDSPVRLRLEGFGTGLDSLEIAAGQRQAFTLRSTPKEAGLFVFKLTIRAGKKVTAEKIPFRVEPRQPLRVLFLESFPTFGSKFLKAYLAEAGHSVAARAAISKEKFRTEFLNAEQVSLNRMTAVLLEKFDLIILDDASLKRFSPTEKAAINSAVRDGIGVLVLASGSPFPTVPPFFGFQLSVAPGPEETRLSPEWSGSPAKPAPVTFPSLFLKASPVVRPLATDPKGQTLAAVKPYGLGRVAVAVAGNTFEWVLSGQPGLHASWWSHLLTVTARKRLEPEMWRVAAPLPQVDRPATIQLVRNGSQLPELTVDSIALYPQQAASGLSLWESTFWPRREGWHMAAIASGKPYPLYIYDPGDWPDLQARQRYEATLAFVNGRQATAATTALPPATRREPVPEIWFYLLFLVSAGYLWLERKL